MKSIFAINNVLKAFQHAITKESLSLTNDVDQGQQKQNQEAMERLAYMRENQQARRSFYGHNC